MDGRIFYVICKVKESLDHDWTVAEMSAVAELSQVRFHKLFKKETGKSPKVYLKDLRLELARKLLETGFTQIKQIVHQTGVTNDSHFTRDFKRKYGISPTEYRKQCWKQQQAVTKNGANASISNTFDTFGQ